MEVYGSMGANNDEIKGLQIKALIDEKNKKIKETSSLDFFTLNSEVQKIIAEVQILQNQCPHKYDENNYCIYCYKVGDFC